MSDLRYWGTMREEPKNLHFLPPVNPMLYEMRLASAVKDRKIWLNDFVDDNSAYEIMYLLQKLKRSDKISGTKLPIQIMLNSGGGSISAGLMVCSEMLQMIDDGYEIITTSCGSAFSMAFMFLICGSKRQAFRHSDIMLHELGAGTNGKLTTMKADVLWFEKTMEVLAKIISERTDIPKEKVDNIGTYDWFLNPEEALKLNVIDVIL